ncbi:hypothetical protein [Salipiger profundus]|uniref:hypothetical protein n=1 Tax=Salipiger profundus TaxID=1229727 RepID=UPI0008E1C126|nr:hypothetical protein [Salipiger profundus]SFD16803.1 hypothetical protein SAMN05444415_10829 [Salipiger profundus]
MDYTLDTLTPSEAAATTGVSMAQQLNLRKGGYLPKNQGHARFDLKGLALLAVYGAFSGRGFGPKVSSQSAGYVSQVVYQHLLYRSEVYERRLRHVMEMELDADCDDLYLREHGVDCTPETRGGYLEALAIQELAAVVDPRLEVNFIPVSSRAPAPEFIVSWPDGTFSYGEWQSIALDFEQKQRGHIDGPFFMASAVEMSKRIAERLVKPMVLLAEGEA